MNKLLFAILAGSVALALAGAASAENVLRIGVRGETVSIDPHWCGTSPTKQVERLIFNRLVQWDHLQRRVTA